jgi:hypothetical protein
LTAAGAAVVLSRVEYFTNNLSSPSLPVFLVFVMAYATASIFLIIFETAVDTIFLCFLVDCEYNKGGNMLAPKALRDLVDAHAKASQDTARNEYASAQRAENSLRKLGLSKENVQMVGKEAPEKKPAAGWTD